MKKLTLVTGIVASFLLTPVLASEERPMMLYHVKITNATTNHILTPPIIIAHKKRFKLFMLGDKMAPASEGLAIMAKSGNSAPLAEELSENPNVFAIVTNTGPVFPGEPSMMYEIVAPKGTQFSVATMLATSNDAFSAVMNIKSPKKGKHTHAMGMTYDAGAEMNNEDCNFIPGPPCNNEMNKDATGEGFVSVHSGIFGKSGLTAAKFNWNGATSMITIHNAGKYDN